MQRKSIYRKLKKGLVVLLVLIAAFVVYVEIANRNSRKMTYRQKVLKAIYPAWMWYNRVTGKKTKVITNDKSTAHTQSLYEVFFVSAKKLKTIKAVRKGYGIIQPGNAFLNLKKGSYYETTRVASHQQKKKIH